MTLYTSAREAISLCLFVQHCLRMPYAACGDSCKCMRASPSCTGSRADLQLLEQVRRTLPFGGGARACIGMPLAQLIVPTTIATLLGQFHFRLADHVGRL